MDLNLKSTGSPIAIAIAVLLIVIVILLAVDMNRRDRTIGEKIENAVEELQK